MARDYDTIIKETRQAMQKVVEHLHQEFRSISAGKASPAMVENIKFDYYGTPTPLNQAAQIGTPDAATITIKPYDQSQVKTISKAIFEANIGLTPSDDGQVIICKLPPMTQETRERLAKQLKDIAENSKVGIRNVRHESIKHGDQSLKDNLLTEDDHHQIKDEIQKITDGFNKEVEETLEAKTADVMKV